MEKDKTLRQDIIDKIIDLRYGCAVLESRGYYGDNYYSKELDKLYKKYPREYEEADKIIEKRFNLKL